MTIVFTVSRAPSRAHVVDELSQPGDGHAGGFGSATVPPAHARFRVASTLTGRPHAPSLSFWLPCRESLREAVYARKLSPGVRGAPP